MRAKGSQKAARTRPRGAEEATLAPHRAEDCDVLEPRLCAAAHCEHSKNSMLPTGSSGLRLREEASNACQQMMMHVMARGYWGCKALTRKQGQQKQMCEMWHARVCRWGDEQQLRCACTLPGCAFVRVACSLGGRIRLLLWLKFVVWGEMYRALQRPLSRSSAHSCSQLR